MILCWIFLMWWQLPISGAEPVRDEVLLEDAFHQIGKQYGVYYDRTLVSSVKVNYESDQSRKMEDALAYVFNQTDLKFRIFDQRYVAVYRESEEGVQSLKKMINHFQDIVDKQVVTKSTRPGIQPTKTLTRTFQQKLLESKALVYSVEGQVTDENGEPLIGVNIQVKGTSQGASTDLDGYFSMEDLDENAILVISYIGFQTQEVSVAGRSNLAITMIPDTQLLDEVVVVGYGTQKKSNTTGAISSIDRKSVV